VSVYQRIRAAMLRYEREALVEIRRANHGGQGFRPPLLESPRGRNARQRLVAKGYIRHVRRGWRSRKTGYWYMNPYQRAHQRK
jgi:hypothetical protein